MPVVI